MLVFLPLVSYLLEGDEQMDQPSCQHCIQICIITSATGTKQNYSVQEV